MSTYRYFEKSSVVAWLQRVPIALDNSPSDQHSTRRDSPQSNKRKYHYKERPVSPPDSGSNAETVAYGMVSPQKTPQRTRKKRKADVASTDDLSLTDYAQDAGANEETPTQPMRTANFDKSDVVSLSSTSTSHSQISNKSSPTKLFPQLSLYPQGLERIPMDLRDPNLPPDLVDLILEMKAIHRGRGVVPTSLKPSIEQLRKESRNNFTTYSDFDEFVYGSDQDWATTSDGLLQDVIKAVDVAVDCDLTQQDETGWNHLVHSPLLDLVLDRQPRNLVSFAPCMTANVTSRYRIPYAPGARVDYAMFVNAKFDDDRSFDSALENLQRSVPESTVNHTPFTSLNKRPISVSIETKRQDGSGDKAILQIGIWQAAQWKMLSELAGSAVGELPFIPGIVVEGHEWKLVATTHRQGRTILWTSQLFGETLSPLGTFQAMAGIHRLKRWTAEIYWPWYKRHVLKLASQASVI